MRGFIKNALRGRFTRQIGTQKLHWVVLDSLHCSKLNNNRFIRQLIWYNTREHKLKLLRGSFCVNLIKSTLHMHCSALLYIFNCESFNLNRKLCRLNHSCEALYSCENFCSFLLSVKVAADLDKMSSTFFFNLDFPASVTIHMEIFLFWYVIHNSLLIFIIAIRLNLFKTFSS